MLPLIDSMIAAREEVQNGFHREKRREDNSAERLGAKLSTQLVSWFLTPHAREALEVIFRIGELKPACSNC